jgi:hypothetical protein
MERYTRKSENGEIEITDLKKAAESLARFEDLFDYVMACEKTIPKALEKLRQDGKEKSYKFREAMGEKLMNTAFILLLKRFDIQ